MGEMRSWKSKPPYHWGALGASLRLAFFPGTGLQGREEPRRMLWQMLACGLHHSAKRGPDHDTEGRSTLNSGVPLKSPLWGFLFGDLFSKKEGLRLHQYWLPTYF